MKYIYEFIGTFFLVFTVAMTVLNPDSAKLLAPLAIGSILAVMVFAGAHVSGGHYNPAISLAVYMRGKLPIKDLGIYWLVQIIGGIIAAWTVMYLKGTSQAETMYLDVWRAFLAEFIFTFALCYVVLNTAYAKLTKGNSYYGFAIGFTVLAGAYAVGPISGGAFNPAVAIGITILNMSFWSNFWVFLFANLIGGACAALLVFKAAHAEKQS